ncbi:DNA-binding protein [Paenibacillus sp. MWE-103]|uniref:DNA-binding protein n=1 Tax=Paenibacillus artemisiicola TaxID=1172618 RepID=A0ABS3WGG2_9BACL|nr:DNA-binding protein [Paenibacillus artemisiicola]MBO7747382.1 DNA-binding protein [Paenibacillus artemisiicola]
MLKFEFDYEQLQGIINSAVDSALERHSLMNTLPPILNRTQFMELLDIGATKAAELLNREDFPVIRELGHPRILTHLLLQWCEEHTEWIKDNAGRSAYTTKQVKKLRRAL